SSHLCPRPAKAGAAVATPPTMPSSAPSATMIPSRRMTATPLGVPPNVTSTAQYPLLPIEGQGPANSGQTRKDTSSTADPARAGGHRLRLPGEDHAARGPVDGAVGHPRPLRGLRADRVPGEPAQHPRPRRATRLTSQRVLPPAAELGGDRPGPAPGAALRQLVAERQLHLIRGTRAPPPGVAHRTM